MKWTHIPATVSTMLDEQWMLRHDNRTICTMRRGEGEWVALLLHNTGIGTTILHVDGGSLEQAKRDCEAELRLGGWPLPTNH